MSSVVNPVLDISTYIFPLNSQIIFNNNNCTDLEIGFGEGEFLVELARKNINRNFLGIEIKRGRFKKAVSYAKSVQLKNIKFLQVEALSALKQVFNDNIFTTVYINFPDPWPKNKHSKHRLFNEDFIKSLSKVIIPSGLVRIRTDHFNYINDIVDKFKKIDHFKNIHGSSGYIIFKRADNTTKFERDFREIGKEIYEATFTNLY